MHWKNIFSCGKELFEYSSFDSKLMQRVWIHRWNKGILDSAVNLINQWFQLALGAHYL